MFWQSLQVTFEIFCNQVAQVGTSVFLDQTRQINEHFGYIVTELIEQKVKWSFVMFMGHIGVPTKEAGQRHELYFYFCVLCHACRVEICFSLFVYGGAILR